MNSDSNTTSKRNEGRLAISKKNANTNKDEILTIKKVKKKDPITLDLLQAIQVINLNYIFQHTHFCTQLYEFTIELNNSIKPNLLIFLLDTKKEYKG